jgi:hypothetical protein
MRNEKQFVQVNPLFSNLVHCPTICLLFLYYFQLYRGQTRVKFVVNINASFCQYFHQLDNGPDLKTKDSHGRTVFHYAYMCEIPDINALLKEHRYLMHPSNDNSTIRSWNIKRWINEHITKYFTTKLQLNVN